MQTRQLKLGAAPHGVGGPGQQNVWLSPEIPGDASVNIDWYIDVAKQYEAAKLDFIFIVDSQFITPHSPPHYLNRLEPLTLLSALAVNTEHLGLVGTLTTSYNSPFNLARRLGSLDLISGGRAGWNVVTSGDAGTAGNYSRDEHFDYPTRYGRALESVRVAQGLWDSYEDDAFPRDHETGVFFDPDKQHALNHSGEFFQVVGPLNLERSRQGQPVIFQAGDSEDGRSLGANIADGVFTIAKSLENNSAFYREMKARAAAAGRDPDQILIMPGLRVRVRDSDEQARAEDAAEIAAKDFDKTLAEFGRPFAWHDFSVYDFDAPFPQQALRDAQKGFRTQAEQIAATAKAEGLTLRQTVLRFQRYGLSPFSGSAETVADTMQEWFEHGAADGFILMTNLPSEFQRFAEEVLPILRRRGLFRDRYQSSTLRGNLGLSIPRNRHTLARELPVAA